MQEHSSVHSSIERAFVYNIDSIPLNRKLGSSFIIGPRVWPACPARRMHYNYMPNTM